MAIETFLLGGRAYSFDAEAARSLSEWISRAFSYELGRDASGPERDRVYRAGLLAELLKQDAAATDEPEPYELSAADVGILSEAMRDYLVAGDRGLEELHAAVQRFEASWDSEA